MSRMSVTDELAYRQVEQRTRRYFLGECATGLGALWMSQALGTAKGTVAQNADALSKPRAKRVIFLHMIGGPSQLDLFDHKPELDRFDGQECPAEFLKAQRFPFIRGVPKMMGTQFPFEQRGESGA